MLETPSQVAIQMDYVDAATTNILSLYILSVEDLRNMLRHIKSELPSTMHLPISLDNTLHFWLIGHPKAMSLSYHVQQKDFCRQKSGVYSRFFRS